MVEFFLSMHFSIITFIGAIGWRDNESENGMHWGMGLQTVATQRSNSSLAAFRKDLGARTTLAATLL